MEQMTMSKKFDIAVYDNAVPEALADELEKLLTGPNFPWYLMHDVDRDQLTDLSNHRVHVDGNSVSTVQLGHGVFDASLNNPFIDKQTIDLSELILKTAVEHTCGSVTPIDDRAHEYEPLFEVDKLRIKFNMLLPNNKLVEGKNNIPHVDNRFTNSYSAIYFVNDSDGDTVIYNEKFTKDTIDRPLRLSVKRRITPKKNRFVLFDGQYFHASTNPRDCEKRIVMNCNIINKWEEPGGHFYKED